MKSELLRCRCWSPRRSVVRGGDGAQAGLPNGEIDEGISQYQKAMAKFREFEREQVAKGAVD